MSSCTARKAGRAFFFDAAGASVNVFQASHEGQRPSQRGVSKPHAPQKKSVFEAATQAPFVFYLAGSARHVREHARACMPTSPSMVPLPGEKTTVARVLARELQYLYLDTGAMYRAVALMALRDGVELDSESAVLDVVRENEIHVELDTQGDRGYRVFAGGLELGDELFTREVASVVSVVAAHPLVREELTKRQREIADLGPVVMAGRDIGTVVLPAAPVKIFLTASVEARVQRRFEEYSRTGTVTDFAHLRAQIEERDRIDRSRAIAPLREADDAFVIDSSHLSPDAVVKLIMERVAMVGQKA